MNSGSLEPREPVLTGEVIESDERYLEIMYEHLGIEELLDAYLDRESEIGAPELEAGLAEFSDVVARTAWKDGIIDVGLVRHAFDHLTASMNQVASERFGYEPSESAVQSVLHKLGIGRQPRRYVSLLNDYYWNVQFMDQFENSGLPFFEREEGESDEDYFHRYVHGSMHSFPYTNFTWMA